MTELLLRLQTDVLEAVARGETLTDVALTLCRRVENCAPEAICSILLVDENGVLHPLAAPSLPQECAAVTEGVQIGPSTGSCGTAAWRNEEVIVTDIANDVVWANFKDLFLSHGLKACWSSPIRNRDDRVIATFAFYYRTPRGPSTLEQQIVSTSVHLCSLAIEHETVRARNYRLAYYDALTGLPNRGHFNEVLASQIAAGNSLGLIMLDIDHLKHVNDTIGHAAGDTLIRAVAHRVSEGCPDLWACRLGGDEIAVIVRNCHSRKTLDEAACRIQSAIRGMVSVGDQSIDAHVTMGGCLFGPDGKDADTLCQNADFALYHAKQTHRGGYVHFRPGLRTAMVERMALVRQLDQAMTDDRIIPYYQPIVRLGTDEIAGVEALARLQLPDGSIITAGDFHPALDDPRIGYNLTGLMLEQVASDVRYWLDAGLPFQHVGVNVSTADFQRGNMVERMIAIFDRAGVPLNHLLVEVNEVVFMEDRDRIVPHAVEALRKQGILVALDDFGTGFASLTHLLSFPVDIIKIDRSFVKKLGTDGPGEVVVDAIIDIARKLNMHVVAEGIENARQVEVLRRVGCHLGQGYLFSRPVPFHYATQLLQSFA